ncbi:MAG: MBL fold metallo-hydrolase [Blastocatellia bacterium]|jgi:hydroxyacylglutathione hydrolase|nr:MBL fold metallo-hydrolase [Blastocatellia bacterium]
MLIERFVLTAFQQNTRIVACEETRRAICIDPGERSDELTEFLRSNDLELQAIALTHGHLDHVGGTAALAAAHPGAEILLHKLDEPLYFGLPQQPLMMGLQQKQLKALGLDYDDPPKLTRNWEHGEVYEVGELKFDVLHCPGHTPGHVVLAEKTHQTVFVGDCLFLGSVGRSDLPGGSHPQLIESITENILSLGDDFTVYSGHGPETTVGHERMTNPFLTGSHAAGGRYI